MKFVILVRQDLKMSVGKLITQISHVCVKAVLKKSKKVELWKKQGMKKIILKVKNLNSLLYYKRKCDKLNIKNFLVKDAGKTEFKKPEITVLGIGPDYEHRINKVSARLKLFKHLK